MYAELHGLIIAKILAADDATPQADLLTRIGSRMATPGYSAPEQIASAAFTTRTDVLRRASEKFGAPESLTRRHRRFSRAN